MLFLALLTGLSYAEWPEHFMNSVALQKGMKQGECLVYDDNGWWDAGMPTTWPVTVGTACNVDDWDAAWLFEPVGDAEVEHHETLDMVSQLYLMKPSNLDSEMCATLVSQHPLQFALKTCNAQDPAQHVTRIVKHNHAVGLTYANGHDYASGIHSSQVVLGFIDFDPTGHNEIELRLIPNNGGYGTYVQVEAAVGTATVGWTCYNERMADGVGPVYRLSLQQCKDKFQGGTTKFMYYAGSRHCQEYKDWASVRTNKQWMVCNYEDGQVIANDDSYLDSIRHQIYYSEKAVGGCSSSNWCSKRCVDHGSTSKKGPYNCDCSACTAEGQSAQSSAALVSPASSVSFPVYGFALIGLGATLFGSYKHFIATKAEEFTSLDI